MNGIIWQAIYNVVNSFTMQEMDTMPIPGLGIKAASHVAFDIFIQRVDVLEDTVVSIEKPDDLYVAEQAKANSQEKALDRAHLLYRALLTFLNRKGHVRFKPPRDFAED